VTISIILPQQKWQIGVTVLVKACASVHPPPLNSNTRMAEIVPYLFITNDMIVIIKLYEALYKPV
jgi:hypothetical protein